MDNHHRSPYVAAPATTMLGPEGWACKSSNNAEQPADPRISPSSRPLTADELDLTLTRQLSDFLERISSRSQSEDTIEKGRLEEPIYVEFEEGDRRNPVNFSKKQKWTITVIACYSTVVAASTASTYAMGFPSMIRDLNCTQLQAITGYSVYALGFAIVPLVTASLSEEFGRRPLYTVSSFLFLLMYLMIALAKNVQTVIVGRFLQGAVGSTAATMVGGTIADIWSPKERGIPMAIFTMGALGGTALGPIIAGWIEMNPHLEWRWIQWIQMMNCGVLFILVLFMKETRPGVLLTSLAKKIRKETGDERYRSRVEDERGSLAKLIFVSCTRPLYLTLTEPIVTAFSLWAGFAWGVAYSFVSVIPLVFEKVHHFNTGLAGTTFVSMIIGSIFGLLTTFWQDSMYRKNYSKRGPEARLYAACFASVLLPAGLFIFAWCTLPNVHWIGLNVAIVCFMWAIYIIYQTVFSYLSDCYGTWASSASAGQSLARNLIGTAFPLFTTQMFERLTFKWAGTLFACIATLMIPIPYVLFFWGPAIRRRSKVSRKVAQV
ncbi:hypothetical protein APHAL10511_005757 [Amanita phalloides]|nr:hypothetical protein APHAL10511_005757 [Amanita phalloides]